MLALRKQAIEAGVRAGVIPQSLAAQLLAITDLNTLPVPVVQGQSSQVTVDGAQGTLISSKEGHLALIWFKDGVLYGSPLQRRLAGRPAAGRRGRLPHHPALAPCAR